MGAAYGVNAVLLDPNHAGTVYLGTSQQGIWKSTDCGSTFIHVNVGTSGPKCGWDNKYCSQVLDTGRNWTMAADPIDSDIIYSNSGFGMYTAGLLKSENGGTDWRPIWPPQNVAADTYKGAPDFVGSMTLDPDDHLHIVIDFHENCSAPHTPLCLAETKDGGETWRIVDTDPAMGVFNAHDALHSILDNGHTWLYTANGSFWRTADSGASWNKVADLKFHSGVFHAPDKSMYIGCEYGIAHSTDGITWSLMQSPGQLVSNLVSDGKSIFASNFAVCSDWDKDLHPYLSAPVAGGTFTPFASPGFTQGGALALDPDHRILYSSNCQAGFWRTVLP